MLFSPIAYLLSMLWIISSQAHPITADTIMQKEMEWAKTSMERHHKNKGYLPLRTQISSAELFPRPDVDYDKDEHILDQNSLSSSAGVDLKSVVPLPLEPEKVSNKLRRPNIPDNIQHENEIEQDGGNHPRTLNAALNQKRLRAVL
jgi:hypothetical protein